MSKITTSAVMTIADREFIIRELSVTDARHILQPSDPVDLFGDSLFEDVRLRDLEHLTSLTKDEIESMLPSQLRTVIEACKEKNSDFFEMLARHINPLARP